MTEKRHHGGHEHHKVTTAPLACGSLCTGAKRQEIPDYIKDEHDGGRPNTLVRREPYAAVRWGAGKVLGGREQAVVIRQLQHNPHKGQQHTKDERHLVNEGPRHFNGSPSPKSSRPSALKKIPVLANYNNPSTSKDAPLPYLAHNLLFARFLRSFTNTKYQSESKKAGNMDAIVSTHRTHRISEEDELSRKSRHHHHRPHPHHHRHHRNGHKSDGELEKDRMRAKIRGGEKESALVNMERCSSDHGKMKDKASERNRRVETDEEREERRRKRKERKETEARLDIGLLLSDDRRGHKLYRREGEKKGGSDNEGNLSSRSNRDKQIILARKEKDSSKTSTRHILSPHESLSPRRVESKQRRQKHEKCSDNSNSSEEAVKEGSSDKSRNLLGFLLERKDKDKMVTCVSCLSDDVPCQQAAKLACNHYFCRGCLKRIFHLSLTDPAHMPPRCCTTDHIPLKHVEKLLSFQTKKHWNKKYTEYTTSHRIYCPSKDCGEWIPPRDIVGKVGRCSRCKTKVCTMCNGKSHGSSDCPQDEDLKAFVKVVKANGYQKCYSCRAVVELDRGCNHITCRCTAEFCYLCGDKWKTCKCPWFAYPDSAEEDDHEDPIAENENTIRERRRRDQREEREVLEAREARERRAREAQMAEDEALARRLATSFLDEETLEKVGDSGTLRTGLRNSYKKLAEEYAEASKRDEEAREERVKDRLQKLRDRDEAIRSAKRESASSHRESRPGTAKHERRHSEPRPSTSRGTHSRPHTAQTPSSPLIREGHEQGSSQHRADDQAARTRIAKYIMGELDNLDDELLQQSSTSTENPAGFSSPQQQPRTERTRRATTSAMSSKPSTRKPLVESKPTYSHHSGKEATTGALPYELQALGTPGYASSSVLADVAFPLEHEKPSRRSSSHTRTHKIKETYANANAKSAPTSPLRQTYSNPPASRKGNLADLGFKFLKRQQNAELYPCPLGYVSAPAPASAHTSYTYSSYTGFGAGPGENSRARQFVQNWGGMDGMGSTWKGPFADRFELATHNPRMGIARTTTY